MTNDQFKEAILSMLNDGSGIHDTLLNGCMSVVDSAYGQEKFIQDELATDLTIPKTVLSAVFAELAWNYEPNFSRWKEVA